MTMSIVPREVASRFDLGHSAVEGTQPRTPSLDHLSLDVLIVIAGFLLPDDIVSLRKTCQALANGTKTRAIWTTAVRQMCTRNMVFLASYDLDAMPLEMLEHTATAPARTMRLLRRHSAIDSSQLPQLSPMTKQLLSLRLPGVSLPDDDHIQAIRLVPGGRFLLALSTLHFHIWDLGQNAYSALKPLPLYLKTFSEMLECSEDLELGDCKLMICEAEQHGKIIFAISGCRTICVYEAELPPPVHQLPSVRRVARMECDFSSIVEALSERYLLLRTLTTTRSIVLWDYQQHTLAKPALRGIDRAFLFKTSVLLTIENHVFVCSIPALIAVPVLSGQLVRYEDLPETVDAPPTTAVTPTLEDEVCWSIRKPWYYRPGAPTEFALFTEHDIFHLDTASIIAPGAPNSVPDHLPYTRARLPLTQDDDLLDCDLTSYISDGYSLILHESGGAGDLTCVSYRVATQDTSTTTTVEMALPARTVLDASSPEVREWDFCPASGRLCILYPDPTLGDDLTRDLHVYDYLVPDRGL